VQNPVVEPMDGPLFIEQLMLRFPEEVYARSRDSHLYKFLTALAGDSGAGILKKQSLLARLQYESAALAFQNLDNLYSPLVGFDRLPQEKYFIDPTSSTLTQEEWDAIKSADDAYRKRALQYLNAARQGGTLQGVTDAATAAIGQKVQVTENYKYIFDQESDSTIGYKKYGLTDSVSEFVIRPQVNQNEAVQNVFASLRIFNSSAFYFFYNGEQSELLLSDYLSDEIIRSTLEGFEDIEQGDVVVTQTTTTSYNISFTNVNLDIQRLAIVYDTSYDENDIVLIQSATNNLFYIGDVGDPSTDYYNAVLSISETAGIDQRSDARDYINPYIQKNLDTLINKIKPQSSVFSISPAKEKYIEVGVNSVFSSSERFYVNRFVTANPNIDYPEVDKLNGKILEQGVENEERNYPFVNSDNPVMFMTIDSVIAYSDLAGYDSAYNTNAFYEGNDPVYKQYESRHAGIFPRPISLIYPFLQSTDENFLFSADQMLPGRDTNAIIKEPVI
jgi:hypothetical protein